MQHRIVAQDEWLAARKRLLSKEKEFTRQRDRLSAERRELPWVKVDQPYVFDGPAGKETLSDLFEGSSQLIAYHFMFGPGWEEGCPSCSFLADHFDGATVHLAQRDVSFVVVSRALPAPDRSVPAAHGLALQMGLVVRQRLQLRLSRLVHAGRMAKGQVEYNYHKEEFPSEEAPGASVFYKDAAGAVFHTYSCYARGLDILVGATTGWTWRPRAAMRASCPGRWPGSATTTATTTRRRVGQAPRRPRLLEPPDRDRDGDDRCPPPIGAAAGAA